MADYTQITSFGPKDSLATGNPAKKIRGTEIDPELSAISTAIATKFDSADIASNAEAAALSSDIRLITPAKLAHALQNASLTLGANILLSGGIAATDLARKSVANTFTANQTISLAEPQLILSESDQGVDAKNWILRSTGSTFALSTATDAGAIGQSAINATRSGTTVTAINFVATALTHGGSTIWTAANDGVGSGLDADLLDGFNLVGSATANTVAFRDASANLFTAYFNSSAANSENPTISQFMVTNGSDGFLRKASLASVQSQLGVLTLAAGEYSPTVSNISNANSISSESARYMRVGNIVTVSGRIALIPFANTTTTVLDITLPVASDLDSNAVSGICEGQFGGSAAVVGEVQANAGGDVMRLSFISNTASPTSGWINWSAQYTVQ